MTALNHKLFTNGYLTSTGSIPLTSFSNSIGAFPFGGYRNGSNGWNEVVDYNSGDPELEKFAALRERLQAPPTQTYPDGTTGSDFDIIYLDFSDGATLIQQNAMTLVELLQWINNPANRTANAEETVVIGASMGGQVSRFALAWMEQQNMCHNSKLWVSFDSPHRGANISLGIQCMFNRLQHVLIGSGSAEDVVQNKLLREATMQMVLFHFSDLAILPRISWQEWQAKPTSYPALLRKVAVANGSGQAVAQPGMTPGMLLLETNGFWTNQVTGLNYAYALPGTSTRGENNVVFRYLKPYALTGNWHYSYCDPSWSYMDQAPGSFRTTSRDAEEQSGGSLQASYPSQTFMSTISALDIKDAGSYSSPNLGYDVRNQILNDRPNRAKYAFDAYFAANNINEPHVQLTNGEPSSYGNTSYFTNNGYWLRNELRESAHQMPASLAGSTANVTYNYGSPYRHLLPSVTVANGGQLYINNGALPVSGGTAATQSAPLAGNFEVYTSGCGTRVGVSSGGSLSVGVSNTYTGSLLVSNNDLLDIGRSGQVTVSEGSVLHIVKGGTLVLRGKSVLVLNGQLVVDAGAYICVENPNSIVTGPNGQLNVAANAHRAANPALGLTGLACQYYPPCTPDLYFDVYQNQRLAAKTSPTPGDTLGQPSFNYCSGLLILTAQGTGLDTDFQWTVNGQPHASSPNNPNVMQFVAHAGFTYDVAVTVHSTCDGSLLSYEDNMVQGNFPNCRVAASPVAMYPNPATSELDFALAAGSSPEAGDYEVSLYDGQGALRWHGRSEAGRLHVACAAFARGLYGVVITQGSTVVRRNLSLE